jgi:hypothetical protein
MKIASVLMYGTSAKPTEARALFERALRILHELAATSRLMHVQQHEWLSAVEAALKRLPP